MGHGAANNSSASGSGSGAGARLPAPVRREKNVAGEGASARPVKRRCVSNACIACRRRKSKCDGNTPACAACSSVYHTDCVYDPGSDHRRKGVYKADIDSLKTQNSTLQTLIEAILNYSEERAFELVRQIRACDSLEDLADSILAEGAVVHDADADSPDSQQPFDALSTAAATAAVDGSAEDPPLTLEAELSAKLGQLRIEDGRVCFIGATSNLMFVPTTRDDDPISAAATAPTTSDDFPPTDPVTTWTTVTSDPALINHLINMYFAWHYPYFTTLSKDLFYAQFVHGVRGVRSASPGTAVAAAVAGPVYCTPLLVNAMLALGCHFSSVPGSRSSHNDPSTAGDHFFKEAKRLILENDEHENPRLPTVQALALMSVREAGCGREAKGWVYSGMSFRMAMDLGLHLDPGSLTEGIGGAGISDEEVDARRVTFWGCYLFDKCWSNYMGRMPQLPSSMVTCPKPEVFPSEDADNWLPYTDTGLCTANPQPSRIRAVSLRIFMLCEISNDVLLSFYNPTPGISPGAATADASSIIAKVFQQGRTGAAGEFKKLSELFTRLEDWRKRLPPELEAKEGALPSVLLMHMFHQTLYIHLFRPFLKFSTATTSSLSHLDPRKACFAAATATSKYLRFYKRRYGLRQICNVAGYFIHSACTIHLLHLSQKTARRDIAQGLRSLEEIGECWLVARRALVIVGVLVKRWHIELPEEAESVLRRCWPEGRRFGLAAEVEKVLRNSDMNTPAPSTEAESSSFSPLALQLPPAPSPAPPVLLQPYFPQLQQQQPYLNVPSPSSGTVSTDPAVPDWLYWDQTELASELRVGMDWDLAAAAAGTGGSGLGMGGFDGLGNW